MSAAHMGDVGALDRPHVDLADVRPGRVPLQLCAGAIAQVPILALCMTFPSGRVTGRAERAIVTLMTVAVVRRACGRGTRIMGSIPAVR